MITKFPNPESVIGYQKITPDPQRLIEECVDDDYITLTQRPGYANEEIFPKVVDELSRLWQYGRQILTKTKDEHEHK